MELSSSPETSLPKIVTDCDLPEGWQRLQVTRNNGASRGKIDTYYIDPAKKKYRSKVQLVKHFGDSLDLTDFDYRTGKMVKASPNSLRKALLGASPKSSLAGWRSNGTASPASSSSLASLCSSNNGSRKSSATSSPASTSSGVLTKAKSPRTAKTMLALHKSKVVVTHPTSNSPSSPVVTISSSASVSASPSAVKPQPQSLLQGLARSLTADGPVSLVASATMQTKVATKRKLDLNRQSSSPKLDQPNGSAATVRRKSGSSKSLNGTILTPEQITDAILTTLEIKDGFHLPENLSVSEIIMQLAKRVVDTPELLRNNSGQPIVVQRVTEEDIRAQEAVVEQYRQQLSEAIAGGPSN